MDTGHREIAMVRLHSDSRATGKYCIEVLVRSIVPRNGDGQIQANRLLEELLYAADTLLQSYPGKYNLINYNLKKPNVLKIDWALVDGVARIGIS